jgi:hypothetical protein
MHGDKREYIFLIPMSCHLPLITDLTVTHLGIHSPELPHIKSQENDKPKKTQVNENVESLKHTDQ